MQFDLSGIPSNAVVTAVSLKMTVAEVPGRMSQDTEGVNYWLLAMTGLSQPWNEGPGIDQSPAATGDTTWFHTQYNPSLHGQVGNYTDNLLSDFVQGGSVTGPHRDIWAMTNCRKPLLIYVRADRTMTLMR